MSDNAVAGRWERANGAILSGLGLRLGAFAMGCEPAPLVAGGRQTSVTDDGRVRCWGYGQYGTMCYGNTTHIGDNETPASAGDVVVGGAVSQLALVYYHTCALLETGYVRCWGRNSVGQLRRGHTSNIGD